MILEVAQKGFALKTRNIENEAAHQPLQELVVEVLLQCKHQHTQIFGARHGVFPVLPIGRFSKASADQGE